MIVDAIGSRGLLQGRQSITKAFPQPRFNVAYSDLRNDMRDAVFAVSDISTRILKKPPVGCA